MAQIPQYLLIGSIELLFSMGIILPEAPGNSSCTNFIQKKYTLAASLRHIHVHVDHYSPFEAWSYHISDGKTIVSQIWHWKVKRIKGIKTAIMNFVSSIKYITESASLNVWLKTYQEGLEGQGYNAVKFKFWLSSAIIFIHDTLSLLI